MYTKFIIRVTSILLTLLFSTISNSEDLNKINSIQQENISATLKDMDKLDALINTQQKDYSKSSKRKFIYSKNKDYRYMSYVDSWKQKIEIIGNQNYPQEAKKRRLYGEVVMTVFIKADGTIDEIKLNRGSGHKVLDDAAINIVEVAAPFAQFSENMRKDIDILGITRTWTFTTGNDIYSR